MSTLRYHADAFRNLQIEPEIDPHACDLLKHREAELGVLFPDAVRELFQQSHAIKLLRGVGDEVVPLKLFGLDYKPSCPIMRILDDRAGLGSFFIYLDGKDDPDVRSLGDWNDWREDENGVPIQNHGSFSWFVRMQAERVLEYEESLRRHYKETHGRWDARPLSRRLWHAIRWWLPW